MVPLGDQGRSRAVGICCAGEFVAQIRGHLRMVFFLGAALRNFQRIGGWPANGVGVGTHDSAAAADEPSDWDCFWLLLVSVAVPPSLQRKEGQLVYVVQSTTLPLM